MFIFPATQHNVPFRLWTGTARAKSEFVRLWVWILWKTTVYPKKYAHGFCFAVLCCGYTLTDFPISIRLTSLALWQSNDCPSASKATLMNMDKYFMWIHYERLHNHNKTKHNKTVCIFLGIYCTHAWPACQFHPKFPWTTENPWDLNFRRGRRCKNSYWNILTQIFSKGVCDAYRLIEKLQSGWIQHTCS